ncbi:MAG: hypothetical protein D6737_20770 [Chloroflexi bacterium]|nr:MAG: hypothetical protein D6737_20770 [Chloroflexota bacterium]
MVHALNTLHEIWRVLQPSGHLLDLRPRHSKPTAEIVDAGEIHAAGVLNDRGWIEDDEAADSAIASVTDEGLYERLRSDSFRLAAYWDDPHEMKAYIEERWSNGENAIPPAVFKNALHLYATAGGNARVRVHLKMQIVLYRKTNHD